MKYTLRQLQVFLATAHHQNISKAANELAMSQSAASAALKDLESQFTIQLFDRVGKRLQINDMGQNIRPKAEALLSMAQELEHDFAQQSNQGNIKLGATLTIGNYLAVGLINKYLEDAPQARVSLNVANTSKIVTEILNFEIDIGLIEGELQHPDLDIFPWRDDTLTCFCAPNHPLARKKHITDDDLTAAQWILREQGSGTRQTFDRAMSGLNHKLHVLLELQHTEAIKRAVESGLGIACLSELTLTDAFKRGTLVPLAVQHRTFDRKFYVLLHKHKYISQSLERWITLCLAGNVAQ